MIVIVGPNEIIPSSTREQYSFGRYWTNHPTGVIHDGIGIYPRLHGEGDIRFVSLLNGRARF